MAELCSAIHRALLSGLLGRIGKFDPEEHDYRGAHGLRFAIHPGSVLAKPPKPPRAPHPPRAPAAPKPSQPPWIMAGELVDTARLFARNAAVIDPDWIEPVAGSICKKHCHSPEWDPQTGFVRATEQVTLYGLVIVPARRCDFSRYDLPLARQIFIRHALVLGDFPHPPAEVRPNLQLLDAMKRRAEKFRRPELFDVEALVAHFSSVLPPEVASVPALRKWLRAGPDQRFFLKKSDWWIDDRFTDTDFPDSIRIGGVKMSLTYRNTPDDPESDGITCTVRKSEAAALRLWRADWLVPGALPEKVAFLISALPSSLRRVLTPINDTVSRLLARLKPGSESLTDALRHTILSEFAYRVPAEAWSNVELPPHLRVRFRIRDDADGRVLACSRDLEAALDQAGVPAPAGQSPTARPRRGAEPSTTWTFGAIPEKTSDAHAGWKLEHFPALHDEGDRGASLQLYANADQAELNHAAGVTRLYLFAINDRLRVPFRRKQLPLAAQIYLKNLNYENDRVSADILAGAVRETLVRNRPPVRDGEEFERRLREGGNALVETQFEMSKLIGDAYTAAAAVDDAIEQHSLRAETADSIRTQLAWLLYPGFPKNVPLARLRHYARYLRGAALRVERARLNPAGDAAKESKIATYWTLYTEAVRGKLSVKFAPKPLAEFRWMLEEYRISLFAQELHTPEPISPKRLDAKLAEAAID